MIIADVVNALRRIESLRKDDESAHAAEDALYADVLRAIADGTAEEPGEMARLALQSKHILFSRWYG